jgi:hypothetical protein
VSRYNLTILNLNSFCFANWLARFLREVVAKS